MNDLPENVKLCGTLDTDAVSLHWFAMETDITTPYYVEGPYTWSEAMEVIAEHLPEQEANGVTTIQIHALRHREHGP